MRLEFKFRLRLGETWGGMGRNGENRGDVAGLARSSELRRTQRLSCAWLFSTWVGFGLGIGLGFGFGFGFRFGFGFGLGLGLEFGFGFGFGFGLG